MYGVSFLIVTVLYIGFVYLPIQRRNELNSCLAKAEVDHNEYLDRACTSAHENAFQKCLSQNVYAGGSAVCNWVVPPATECALAKDKNDRILAQLQTDKDNCFKQFPQK